MALLFGSSDAGIHLQTMAGPLTGVCLGSRLAGKGSLIRGVCQLQAPLKPEGRLPHTTQENRPLTAECPLCI